MAIVDLFTFITWFLCSAASGWVLHDSELAATLLFSIAVIIAAFYDPLMLNKLKR